MDDAKLQAIRESLIAVLERAGYDTSGTDHSELNEIEVGFIDQEFRISISEL